MIVISVLATIAYYALLLYFLAMWVRFALDLARNFARTWRPKGFVLILAEIVFSLTDPPLRAVRRIIPPIRLGGVALDFGWSIVMLGVIIAMSVAGALRG